VSSPRWTHLILFATALLVAGSVRGTDPGHVGKAIVWLPSGVAIAGLWLLGNRAVWVVAVMTAVQRALLVGTVSKIAIASLGSSCEALLGVFVLRHLAVAADFARLRDVLGLFVAASVAPIGSLVFSAVTRLVPGVWENVPLYEGWNAWWRMNALGVLMVVPVTLTWSCPTMRTTRGRAGVETGLLATGAILVLAAVMAAAPSGPTSILLLHVVLIVVLWAALRGGVRGAASTAAAATLFVAAATVLGHGPFLSVPFADRHGAVQVFGLTLLAVPLVIGSLIAEREATVQRLAASEGLRHALLRVLPDHAVRLRDDGTVLEAFAPATGAPPLWSEAPIGRNLRQALPGAVAGPLAAALDAARAGSPPSPVEFRLDTPAGPRDCEARHVRLAGDELLSIVRDISERKVGERSMAFQAAILELLATDTPLTDVLAAVVEGIELALPGTQASVLLLRGNRLHTGHAPSLPAEYCRAIDGVEIGPACGSCGTAAWHDRRVVVADIEHDPLWAGFSDLALRHGLRACWSQPVHAPDGTVLGTFAIYRHHPHSPDAVELALVERAATLAGIGIDRDHREQLLASIHRNVVEGLFRSVPGQGLVYVNQTFARLFGYETTTALLTATADAADAADQHHHDLVRLAAGGIGNGDEALLHRRDGSTFHAQITCTEVRAADGRCIALDGAVANVSDRHRLEERLRQAQKMEAVGQLAGGVAHDFNNLLTAMLGGARAIVQEAAPGSQARADAEEIARAAERAAGLVRQLLAFSRQQVLSPQVVDLGAVVDNFASMLRRVIGEHIAFACERASMPLHVHVDRGQIEQVLMNLAVNARDAMPSGGSLRITTGVRDLDAATAARHGIRGAGACVELVVQDTGSGMSEEVRARAFDPFFTTKEVGKGTGLGLATVYGIVTQSGGAIWIDSSPGAGSTVTILLPRITAQEPSRPAEVPAPPQHRAGTVLVVEDEPLVRDYVTRTLTKAGYSVLTAPDGPAALELSSSHRGRLDLLLTDVVMPQFDGRELARRLREDRPDLPVVFMSGYSDDPDGSGPQDTLLQKPFASGELLDAIGNALTAR
jgi:PAS domain S-box-containing protein